MKEQELKATKQERAVLDAYFSIRQPNGMEGMDWVQENKLTLQIQDDLRSALFVSEETIVDYMLAYGFMLKPHEDGSVVWNIYRMR